MKLHTTLLGALALATPLGLQAQDAPPVTGKITIITVDKDGKQETKTVELTPETLARLGDLAKPAESATPAAAEAVAEKVTYLGVMLAESPAEATANLPIVKGSGLLVGGIADGSPAKNAGLQPGDVLAKLDDQILVLPAQLTVLVRSKKEGDMVKLSYFRGGKAEEATVALGSRPADEVTVPPVGLPGAAPAPDWGALLGQLGGGQALDILKGRVIRVTPDGRIEMEEAKGDGHAEPWLQFNREAAKERMEKYRKQWDENMAKAGEWKDKAAEGIKKQLAELKEQMERAKRETAKSQAESAAKLAEEVEKAKAEAHRAQEQLKKAIEEMKRDAAKDAPPAPKEEEKRAEAKKL